MSLESTHPGEARAAEPAGAAPAGSARDGGGDVVPTPTPTGDEAWVADIPGADGLPAEAPVAAGDDGAGDGHGAGGYAADGGDAGRAGISGAGAPAADAPAAGGEEGAGGGDAGGAGTSGAGALAAEAPAAGDPEGGTGGARAADLPPEVARLAGAVADLDDLGELPVPEHVGRYDAVHAQLSEALASIDEV